jgi:hypothetical protein
MMAEGTAAVLDLAGAPQDVRSDGVVAEDPAFSAADASELSSPVASADVVVTERSPASAADGPGTSAGIVAGHADYPAADASEDSAVRSWSVAQDAELSAAVALEDSAAQRSEPMTEESTPRTIGTLLAKPLRASHFRSPLIYWPLSFAAVFLATDLTLVVGVLLGTKWGMAVAVACSVGLLALARIRPARTRDGRACAAVLGLCGMAGLVTAAFGASSIALGYSGVEATATAYTVRVEPERGDDDPQCTVAGPDGRAIVMASCPFDPPGPGTWSASFPYTFDPHGHHPAQVGTKQSQTAPFPAALFGCLAAAGAVTGFALVRSREPNRRRPRSVVKV